MDAIFEDFSKWSTTELLKIIKNGICFPPLGWENGLFQPMNSEFLDICYAIETVYYAEKYYLCNFKNKIQNYLNKTLVPCFYLELLLFLLDLWKMELLKQF